MKQPQNNRVRTEERKTGRGLAPGGRIMPMKSDAHGRKWLHTHTQRNGGLFGGVNFGDATWIFIQWPLHVLERGAAQIEIPFCMTGVILALF